MRPRAEPETPFMAPAPVKIGLPVGVGAVWTPVEAIVLLATPEVTELGAAVLEHS